MDISADKPTNTEPKTATSTSKAGGSNDGDKAVTRSSAMKKSSSKTGIGANKLNHRQRRRGRLPESDIRQQRAVVYVGRIPHGFFEAEMREFFSQFGRVTRVRLCRSNKSEKSKGYAFIEFREPEVAKIAAETMDGYMMFDKRLICHVVPSDHIHRDTFRARILGIVKNMQPKKIGLKKKSSKPDDDSRSAAACDKPEMDAETVQTSKMQKKLNKLAKLGITAPLALSVDKLPAVQSPKKSPVTPVKAAVSEKATVVELADQTSQKTSISAGGSKSNISDDEKRDATPTTTTATKRPRTKTTKLPAVSISPASKTPPLAKRLRSAKRNVQ